MAAQPGYHSIEARVGQPFLKTYQYEDENGVADLTGYTANLIARRTKDGPVLVYLTTDSFITISAENEIIISASSLDTSEWPDDSGDYDLNLVPPSGEANMFTILTGRFVIHPRVKPGGAE